MNADDRLDAMRYAMGEVKQYDYEIAEHAEGYYIRFEAHSVPRSYRAHHKWGIGVTLPGQYNSTVFFKTKEEALFILDGLKHERY